ncbi:MAG: cobalt-precorrin-5B (C(1))-methyltransferase CbiD [Vulcanococcus sp.]|jgi:cobalt-precorrin-5B (C1)-methyltransferase|uniref:cobalt-precorrin-5B (C(1))-methyltransferase CbiD n=1 Tax=Vulcanococcus sp. TaxID=2856995 RepID=UPI0025D80C1B|nr:cobalt-precorrin-5B (C(1))-methyltransferase CbiD [Vulcanococcus sp.]MBW0173025.1 cobalt-precorrin-5B (C(1))-methyltransferase CbiD [Vulcanococcus sp.]MBW0181623.1 cobalt-precorrin-5B (C(1))-methyltransferase CbiD [Vulcanococcus sp.]
MTSSGYTLPVWVAAAAVAAVRLLRGDGPAPAAVPLCLQPDQAGSQLPQELIDVEAAALLAPDRALGISRCQPGDGLDLTRGLAVWVEAQWTERLADQPWLQLEAGEGVGVLAGSSELCVSGFARALLECNLQPLMPESHGLRLRITLPGGRQLAQRTSNEAFGVVDGLALIGTQAAVQRSADPDQLARARAELARRANDPALARDLVLVIGENGLDLAPRLGLQAPLLLKAGNWIGPLLVAAAEQGVERLLLFGYQGKLIKLAGGIFHTHHHLADGRLEVLTAQAALLGLPLEQLQQLAQAASVDEALRQLAALDASAAQALQHRVASAVEQRSAAYLARHGERSMCIGAVLFDRDRRLCAEGPCGAELLQAFRA